jgi:phosphate transport system substrate-binding protein
VLSRETSSGTHVFFKETVLNNQNFAPGILLMTSTKAIAQEIANNPNAIGYGGVAYFKNKRGVKICLVNGIEPTDANIRAMKYPISRYLYWYTAGKPKGDAAKLVAFALSPQGQQVVERVGYVSLSK